MDAVRTASFILRIGLGLMFLYAAIDSLIMPDAWVGFFPAFIQDLFPGIWELTLFSLAEIALAFWLFSGWNIFYAAIASAVLLLGITITNLGAFILVFRDFGLAFAAAALAMLHWKDSKKSSRS